MPEIRATDSTQVLSATMPITRLVPAVDHPEGQPVESEGKVELNAISSATGEYRYGEPHFTTNSGVALTEGEKLALLEKIGLTAPVNVDVPVIAQEEETLTCTMGNWEERLQPDTYTYQWQRDGDPVGDGSNKHILTEEDNGHTFLCQVTATNRVGSTSVVSNEIEIPGGIARREEEEEHRIEGDDDNNRRRRRRH